ncbi:hypothetical protein GFS24_21230 [Chitinophaga sp. SYP-B3965]|uniref:nucleotidyl transferase AbiEii/AbiGii toxin family protein n=1 Tax=Chitinophaga sp. SYP-B3965 TaxID=2663120 RepID=UPI001299A3CC|nr:nucleotidyl transferase AbiEii/AbiGii toxin family protein [Chitinophaga sp. SYP-B3965]MRG47660.1 hypothetical protein [Chitinophaga sp. SYP-B3965]
MNEVPAKQIIEDVAAELEIAPAFVEKDWYVTQVIKLMADFSFDGIIMVFSGGTSLSKAHNILHRFSEDIDFRITGPELDGLNPSQRRAKLSALKRALLTYLQNEFPQLQDSDLTARDNNRFFAINLTYPTQFDPAAALRPHVLLEFSVATLMLPSIALPVSSFVAIAAGTSPEVAAIECIDPVENATDKMSAFVWRTVERKRGTDEDDPAIVRHMHDLSLLQAKVITHPQFKNMVLATLEQDDRRSEILTGLTPGEKFARAITLIKEDEEYKNEYNRFVEGMSYAATSKMPGFDQAIANLDTLINHVLAEN